VYLKDCLYGRFAVIRDWFLEIADLHRKHPSFKTDDCLSAISFKSSERESDIENLLTASSLVRSSPPAFVLKYSMKSSASIVADDIIILNSGLFFIIFFNKPSKRSVYAPLSWASSIYNQLCMWGKKKDLP
jgi:hypothetical protein